MVALCLRHVAGVWSRGCGVHVRGGVRERLGEGKGSNNRGHAVMLQWSSYVYLGHQNCRHKRVHVPVPCNKEEEEE